MTTPTSADARAALSRMRSVLPADTATVSAYLDRLQRHNAGLLVDIENFRARIDEATEAALDRAALEQTKHFVVVGPGREPVAFVDTAGIAAAGRKLARDLTTPMTSEQMARRFAACGIEYGAAASGVLTAAVERLADVLGYIAAVIPSVPFLAGVYLDEKEAEDPA